MPPPARQGGLIFFCNYPPDVWCWTMSIIFPPPSKAPVADTIMYWAIAPLDRDRDIERKERYHKYNQKFEITDSDK